MSVIRVRRKHSLGYDRACKTAEDFAEKLHKEYNADYHWKKNALHFTAKGLNGNIHIDDDSVEIRVNLGLMYRPFKTKIEKSITSELDDILKA